MITIVFAGEALGAIGSVDVLETLQKYSKDPVPEVAETCELAVGRIQWVRDHSEKSSDVPANPYCSIDPTPPSEDQGVANLRNILLDDEKPLFDRYRAMFSLRNQRTPESIRALCEGKFFLFFFTQVS